MKNGIPGARSASLGGQPVRAGPGHMKQRKEGEWCPMKGWNGWLGVYFGADGRLWEPSLAWGPLLPVLGLFNHILWWLGAAEPGLEKERDA